MARPRKRINNTPYPDHVIDAVARTFYSNLLEDWQKENNLNQINNIAPTVLQSKNIVDTIPKEINIPNTA